MPKTSVQSGSTLFFTRRPCSGPCSKSPPASQSTRSRVMIWFGRALWASRAATFRVSPHTSNQRRPARVRPEASGSTWLVSMTPAATGPMVTPIRAGHIT